jgi:hypothetical protein
MSYSWEPKWIRKKIAVAEGIEIETCYDASTGLMLCPLCVNVSKVCPSSTEPTTIIPENVPYFFSPEDIVHHMKTHAKAIETRKLYTEVEVEEEEVEGEEE